MLVSNLLSYCQRMAGVLGVGQVPLAQDTADALTALTVMLTQWQARRWLVFRLEELECPVVSGQATYTIGPGAQIDTGSARRPTDIEAAYVRQINIPLTVDYPLARIDSREEWSRIALKSLQSWPGSFFYDPTLPDGTFTLWPVPMQAAFFELHVTIKPDISQWIQPTTDTNTILPAETDEALIYNLTARLRSLYALPPSPDINALAAAALQTMRSTNFRSAPLRMPAAVMGRGGRVKNPNAGFVEATASVPFSVLP